MLVYLTCYELNIKVCYHHNHCCDIDNNCSNPATIAVAVVFSIDGSGGGGGGIFQTVVYFKH